MALNALSASSAIATKPNLPRFQNYRCHFIRVTSKPTPSRFIAVKALSAGCPSPLFAVAGAGAPSAATSESTSFRGPCFVVGNNIDTDQIIPAEHLTLLPSVPEEYKKLGSFAFSGLPSALYPTHFISPSGGTKFSVVIGGANFGCGSSREHAPVAIGAAGCRVIVAESYARIFFRNSVATGEVYPVELETAGAFKECKTGDVVYVDLERSVMVNESTGKEYKLKPIGDAGPVIQAGGIFAYARKTGMIASHSNA